VLRLVSSGSRYPAALSPSKNADLDNGCVSSSLGADAGMLRGVAESRTAGLERFEAI